MAGRRCHRWLDEEVIKFIRLYRNMECLWNIMLRDHKDNTKRERAYEIIREQMGVKDLTVLDVKRKIRSLRSTYKDELNKIAASMKGDKSVITNAYKPKVFWFNLADSFLKNVTRHGTMTSKRDESLYAVDEQHHIDTEEDQDYSDNSHMLDSLYPEQSTHEKEPQSFTNKEDEYDLFGRSMAIQLRKLPELMSLELMQKMQLMVINAKKHLSKERSRVKQRPKSGNSPSTSRKVSTPSPVSSEGTTYKFEVMDPDEGSTLEAGASSTCGGVAYTYVQGNYPITLTSRPEPFTSSTTQGEKRKLSNSANPMEIMQNIQSHFQK